MARTAALAGLVVVAVFPSAARSAHVIFDLNGSCSVRHPSTNVLVRTCRLSGAGATVAGIEPTLIYRYTRSGDSHYRAAQDVATMTLLDPSSKGTLALTARAAVSYPTLRTFTARGTWRAGTRSGAWTKVHLGSAGTFVFSGAEEQSLTGTERLSVRATLSLRGLG
jgi:hypothetical protein